jgi:hypothetical protein
VKRFWKYRRKLWNDMENMDEMWNDMENMEDFCVSHNYTQRDLLLLFFLRHLYCDMYILMNYLFNLYMSKEPVFIDDVTEKMTSHRESNHRILTTLLKATQIFNYERKISWIVKRFWKYRRKLWNDMENMDEMWNDMENMEDFCVSHNYTQRAHFNLLFFYISISFHYSTYFSYLFTIIFCIFQISSLFNLGFFHIFHIISQFSSVFSKSHHYSTWVSSIFFISFHYSAYFYMEER